MSVHTRGGSEECEQTGYTPYTIRDCAWGERMGMGGVNSYNGGAREQSGTEIKLRSRTHALMAEPHNRCKVRNRRETKAAPPGEAAAPVERHPAVGGYQHMGPAVAPASPAPAPLSLLPASASLTRLRFACA